MDPSTKNTDEDVPQELLTVGADPLSPALFPVDKDGRSNDLAMPQLSPFRTQHDRHSFDSAQMSLLALRGLEEDEGHEKEPDFWRSTQSRVLQSSNEPVNQLEGGIDLAQLEQNVANNPQFPLLNRAISSTHIQAAPDQGNHDPNENILRGPHPSIRKQPILRCPQCSKTFRKNRDMQRHVANVHSGELKFPCILCQARFRTQRQLNQHTSQLHRATDREDFRECPYCKGIVIGLNSMLKRHIRNLHTGELNYWCETCFAGFKTQAQLGRHESVMHDSSLAASTIADVRASGLDVDHPQTIRNFSEVACPDNGPADVRGSGYAMLRPSYGQAGGSAQHATERRLGEDINIAVESTSAPYPAITEQNSHAVEEMFEEYDSALLRNEHRKMALSAKSVASGAPAGLTLKAPAGPKVAEVVNVHSSNEQTTVGSGPSFRSLEASSEEICANCNASFSRPQDLRRHMNIYHSGSQNFHCTMCRATFNCLRHQTEHILRVHNTRSKSPGVACPKCGARQSAKGLNRHMTLSHTGEQPHHCSMCHARFKTANQLLVHKKSMHQ